MRDTCTLLSQPKEGDNYRDPIGFAREKTDWILANHHPELLTENQQAEFNRILRAAEGEMS